MGTRLNEHGERVKKAIWHITTSIEKPEIRRRIEQRIMERVKANDIDIANKGVKRRVWVGQAVKSVLTEALC